MTNICKHIIITGILVTSFCTNAQQAPRYWNDIVAFKTMDSNIATPANPILLIGSSSFTNWKTVIQDFADYPILNRAFGGAIYQDLIRYFYEVVVLYHPKQILVYCGDNDLGFFNISPQTTLLNFKTLFAMIRTHFPNIEVDFVSIKPSPRHCNKQDSVQKANALIRNFLKTQSNSQYIDIYTPIFFLMIAYTSIKQAIAFG